jgi:hypothetical protein
MIGQLYIFVVSGLYLLLIYDVETGKPVLVDYSDFNKRPQKFILKAIIYNQLYDLKNGK